MLEVKKIEKSFGGHTVLHDLNFTIRENGIYGLLGQNGAGKTTTMNIITGYIGADGGDVLVDGQSILEQPGLVKRRLGYLPEVPPLYNDMTPREFLIYAAKLKQVKRGERQSQVEDVMEAVGLQDYSEKLIRNLSKGTRQRVGIAQAVLGAPRVIILDEPMVGLDPLQMIEIRQYIESLGQTSIVLVSSHILSEIQAICREVLILASGRIVARDTPHALESRMRTAGTVRFCAKGSQQEVSCALSAAGISAKIEPGEEPGTIQGTMDAGGPGDVREQLFLAFSRQGLPLLELAQNRASLEDVFIEIMDRENRAEEGER